MLADAIERRWYQGLTPRCHHDGVRLNTHAFVDHKRGGPRESRVSTNALLLRDPLGFLNNSAHEPIALALDPPQDRRAIDPRGSGMNAEVSRVLQVMCSRPRGHKQFRRHAAHPRAGCTIRATLDHDRSTAPSFHFPSCVQSGSAGTDHRHVYRQCVHITNPLRQPTLFNTSGVRVRLGYNWEFDRVAHGARGGRIPEHTDPPHLL